LGRRIRCGDSLERQLGRALGKFHVAAAANLVCCREYAAASVEQAAREAAERSPNSLVAKYREMANDSEREREAEEWSEGLIGDASAQG
jgi:hypothetical protein